MTGRRGFTLLEMIVASAIMAIAVVGLMAGLSGAARSAARLRNYDRAEQLARLRMNELLLDDRFPRNTTVEGAFDGSLTGGVPAGWRAKHSLFELPPLPAIGQFGLDRVELQIWWMDGKQERTFSLDAYKRRRLAAEDIPPVEVAP